MKSTLDESAKVVYNLKSLSDCLKVGQKYSPVIETNQIKKKTRRGLSKSKTERNQSDINSSLNFMGINAAGIMSKIDSLESWLNELTPEIFTIQETKVAITGQIKLSSKNSYQIYEKIRAINPGQGGGLCIGRAQTKTNFDTIKLF